MADAVDMAGEIEGEHLARGIAAAGAPLRAAAGAPLRAGAAGECEGCEYWMPRLVDGLCGFCRDGRRRPDDWEPPVRPTPTTKQAAPPAPVREEPIMAESKSITFIASGDVLAAIKRLTADGETNSGAALALIAAGLAPASAAPVETPIAADITTFGVGELLAEVSRRLADAAGEADALQTANARADDAEARAATAEGRLEAIKQAFAA